LINFHIVADVNSMKNDENPLLKKKGD